MTGPISRFEHLQREQRRRERRIRLAGFAICLLSAVVVVVGAWAVITALIGVFG